MKCITAIQQAIRKVEGLKKMELSDGTQLIGHVPHIAPEAYLHLIFPGLSKERLRKLEKEIKRPLPPPLRQFYAHFNGVDLFSSSLAIHGLRQESMEDDELNVWLPFSMEIINVDERVPGAPKDAVFFATYEWDGSLLFMSPKDEAIVRCSRDSAEPLNQWASLDDALVTEISRLSAMFDARGKKVDPELPSIPVARAPLK